METGILFFQEQKETEEVYEETFLYTKLGRYIKGDKTMKRKPIKSFDNLRNGDLIISPIDNEVTQYLEGKDGNKYLANKNSMYPLYQFNEKDFYFYEGTKEIGEVDTTW